jgi:hypothetical protein
MVSVAVLVVPVVPLLVLAERPTEPAQRVAATIVDRQALPM